MDGASGRSGLVTRGYRCGPRRAMQRAVRPAVLRYGVAVGADAGGEQQGPAIEVLLERAVARGRVLGRDDGGRVVLVEGALPGERAMVALQRDTPRFASGAATEVLEAAPGRVEPPCPHVAAGCGGCDLQHATPELQAEMRLDVVRDALSHLGGMPRAQVAALPIEQVEPSVPRHYRTTLRLAVAGGRAALRHRRSHDPVRIPTCLVAHPLLAPVLADGHFGVAREVTVRASVATGEVLAVVSPSAEGVVVPDGVRVVGDDELSGGERVWFSEAVDGHRLRVSARSFFQSGPLTAAALCRAVRRAVGDFDPEADRFVDLYGGIGLFTVLLGARRSEVVERSGSAVADARVNCSDLGARVVKVGVGRWRPSAADVVVADPSREGLGAEGVAAVTGTGARRVVLVSCDPAALGRDVALLRRAGLVLDGVEVVDMFPHTHHVETVSRVTPGSAGG